MRREIWIGRVRSVMTEMLVILMSGAVALADYPAEVLKTNPIGYWRLNETDTSVAENVGSGQVDFNGEFIDGVQGVAGPDRLADGTPITGMGVGNVAFRVGPEESYMSVSEPVLDNLEQFTMSGWFFTESRDDDQIALMGQNDLIEFGFPDPANIQMWAANFRANDPLNWTIDSSKFADQAWNHLAVVGNGYQSQLYVNGELEAATGQPPGSYGVSSFDFNIGGGGVYDPSGNQFTGTLDEIAVFDRALTEEQLTAHLEAANAAGGDYAAAVLNDSPLGYWRLDEKTGGNAVNSADSGARYDGTYNGGERGTDGPGLPGLGPDNVAFRVSADTGEPEFINISASLLNNLSEFTFSGFIQPGLIVDNRVGLWGQNDVMEFGFITPDQIQMWTPGGGATNWDHFGEVEEDEWYHLAAVGDGDEITIYLDGEEVAFGGSSVANRDPIDTYGESGFPFNVGAGVQDDIGNQLTGVVDEVAVWDLALSPSQILAQFQSALGEALAGDYNGDGVVDAADADSQAVAMKTPMQNLNTFDENGDGEINSADRLIWIHDHAGTWVGDANLDGEFNSGDFVDVFTAGRYETGEMAGWAEGDWDGSMFFDSGDFVTAFTDGGYELGPFVPAAAAAVPEPSAIALLIIGVLGLTRCRVPFQMRHQ